MGVQDTGAGETYKYIENAMYIERHTSADGPVCDVTRAHIFPPAQFWLNFSFIPGLTLNIKIKYYFIVFEEKSTLFVYMLRCGSLQCFSASVIAITTDTRISIRHVITYLG